MERTKLLAKNFNWRMLSMRIVLNMIALLLTVGLIPSIYLVDKRVVVWFGLALALGVLNAVIKPIIEVLTLRFIFATAGLVLILINAAILMILAWLFPQYIAVDSFWWALVGGAVLGLSTAFLESLLGLSQPIVSEKYPELRERVKDRQFYRTQAELMRIEAQKPGIARELAVTKVVMSGVRPVVLPHGVLAEEAATDAALAGSDGEPAPGAPQGAITEQTGDSVSAALVTNKVESSVPGAGDEPARVVTDSQQQEAS